MSDKYINRIKKLTYNKENKGHKKKKRFKIVSMRGEDIIQQIFNKK